jgi:hypothetical protein
VTDPRPKLRDRGNVYVSLAALRSFLDLFEDDFDGDEQARIELTRYCCEATLREEGSPAYYRYRSRPEGVDLSLRVVDEPPLAIVVALEARRY